MANKVIKINVEKTTQDFEIGPKTYTMDFNDDKIKQYGECINNITAAIDETKGVDPMQDIDGTFDKLSERMKQFTDLAFGEGSFKELYEVSGRSNLNLSNIIVQVIESAQSEMKVFKEARRQEEKAAYYKNKNNK